MRMRGDFRAVALALVLVGVAVGAGAYLNRPGSGVVLLAPAAPLFAVWLPHVGPGSVFAVLIAFAVVAWGPSLAGYLRWGTLLGVGYAVSVAWTFALAMIDGWHRGFADRLTNPNEYLHEVPGITDIPAMLRGFSARILDFQPNSWTTHVSGHPPGATLVFVWLDRIGLGGGAWAATVCVLVGCLVTVAVPVTVKALSRSASRAEPALVGAVSVARAHDQRAGAAAVPAAGQALGAERGLTPARAVLLFAALFPGAVWVGVSADGLFAGVTASGIALLALGTRRLPLAVLGGLLLGFGAYLSYGLVLLGLIALAVTYLGRGLTRALPLALLGALAVVAAFTAAGFWWLDGYHLVVERYYQGVASERPYWYWVWANLACLVLAAGPALVAGVRRTGAVLLRRDRQAWRDPALVLVAAAVITIVLADLSGLSKSEVERIWLPFTVWLLPAAALLPRSRWWLAGQAVTALAVNHLVLTYW
ncbi:hypothetical protein HFP15_36805 [Amycolatopsis sp. K13G38]|uniref:Integral membrane protein n=1 Tax=Amycolatopsis acididurans TaxID=2724524 RepID=A0ABX1JII4_9PSEU|nr:hypothetical protein [Amycolatopsis acididurans]NKQ58426.1 hypothetical protein [Amycolatopsis acididurans]